MPQECVANKSWTRPSSIGMQAVVVGAGIAGIAAARVLADWFETVILLERDPLPDAPTYRTGTPQARHPHVLLLSLDNDFMRAGAVPLQVNQDLREELPDGRPIPQRDLGLTCFALTRPRIEYALRQRLAEQPNIIVQDSTRVVEVLAEPSGRRIKAVRCEDVKYNRSQIVPADLVVDASGRGQLTVTFLKSTGRPFQQTEIDIDIKYSTAVLDVPDDVSRDWKAVVTHNKAPHLSRRAVLLPIEGNRWLMTALGYRDDHPPRNGTRFCPSCSTSRRARFTTRSAKSVRRTTWCALAFRRVFGGVSSACRTFRIICFRSETQSPASIRPTVRA